MSFHPKQTHWFEAEIPRDQTVYALETLAESGFIELEDKGYRSDPCLDVRHLNDQLARIGRIVQQYGEDLPPPASHRHNRLERPEKLAESAADRIQKWSVDLANTRSQLRRIEVQIADLLLLSECLDAMGDDACELIPMSHATGLLSKHLFACPHGTIDRDSLGDGVFETLYEGPDHEFWLVIGQPARQRVFEGAAALFHCDAVKLPNWLPQEPAKQKSELARRVRALKDSRDDLSHKLETLRSDTDTGTALSDYRLIRWYSNVVINPSPDHSACQVTGWTTASTPLQLEGILREAGLTARIVFAPPRGDLRPPVKLDSSSWSRPFRLFVELLGIPGKNEIDPTPLLALIVPLLFGFMFPDLGHGLILAAAGFLLSKRHKVVAILVPCGLAAAGFGLVFGEVFGFHDLFPSPCGCPLDNPLRILLATLILGISLLMLGLVLAGIEAWWRGELAIWFLEQAPVIALYLSSLVLIIAPRLWLLPLVALAWYLTGSVILCRDREGKCLLSQLGRLVESSFQLAVATFSFLRVGAFALAHSAFSVVVFELIGAFDSTVAQMLVFTLGHLFIVVVEGLIVMVQTTRLVVFEFFARFLRLEGRIYRPLQSPNEIR